MQMRKKRKKKENSIKNLAELLIALSAVITALANLIEALS